MDRTQYDVIETKKTLTRFISGRRSNIEKMLNYDTIARGEVFTFSSPSWSLEVICSKMLEKQRQAAAFAHPSQMQMPTATDQKIYVSPKSFTYPGVHLEDDGEQS